MRNYCQAFILGGACSGLALFHHYVKLGICSLNWRGDPRVSLEGGDCHASDYAALIGPTSC